MRVGGLVKLSTLDYPGRVSAVVFSQSCNFRCPYCHNPGLVRPFGELLDEAGVVAFLKSRASLLDGVVISGGEPTILEDLASFIKMVKELGFRVKLDTNGSRPGVLASLLEKSLVDYVAMDLKSDPQNYPEALAPASESGGVEESIAVLKKSGLPHEFRTTAALPFVDDSAILAISKAARGKAPLYLQKLNLKKPVFNPAFMARHPVQPNDADLQRFRDLAARFLPCHIR
ncbi:MAG: anaerobic ribonucleoside-triphosphate reductase activating protein [Deltaproteobacteria bacterium]|jgi:pyruvate formate lyase activating enzyme|nr:anaerobic ribonucleoside-triphosphate reductase activating protein [Deltaproteobacteria bacterium]